MFSKTGIVKLGMRCVTFRSQHNTQATDRQIRFDPDYDWNN